MELINEMTILKEASKVLITRGKKKENVVSVERELIAEEDAGSEDDDSCLHVSKMGR